MLQTWYGTVPPGHLATTALLAASYLEGGGWSEEMVRMTGQVRTGAVIGLSQLHLELQTIHRFHNRFSQRRSLRAFSWLKAPTSAFTFKTLLRHYAKQTLTPR